MVAPSAHGHSEGHPSQGAHISPLPIRQATDANRTGGGLADLEQAINVLRARIDEEFRISERLDSKGRQLFALAGGFFAAVQAVAFSALNDNGITDFGHLALLLSTLIGGAVLVIVGHRLVNAEKTLEEKDIQPEDLVDWVEENQDETKVLLQLIGALAEVARSRTLNNRLRNESYERLQTMARWSLIASGIELIVAVSIHV